VEANASGGSAQAESVAMYWDLQQVESVAMHWGREQAGSVVGRGCQAWWSVNVVVARMVQIGMGALLLC
jgi:hypothetical protein